MHSAGNTKERKNDIAAEIAPLLSAVNNDDAYMLNHITKNGSAQITNARFVIASNAASYPTKKEEITPAERTAVSVKTTEAAPRRIRLLRNTFFISPWLAAPK